MPELFAVLAGWLLVSSIRGSVIEEGNEHVEDDAELKIDAETPDL